MNSVSSVATVPLLPADIASSYEAAVAKKVQELLTLEGQAALKLITEVPIAPDEKPALLNEKA